MAHYDDKVFVDGNAGRLWELGFSSRCLGGLLDAFARLPEQRLVILGGPGAGKTELSTGFAFRLLERREEGGPVPALLSLGAADPGEEPLDHWIARQLVDKYGLVLEEDRRGAFDLALKLVETGRVVPILDGLDAWAEWLQPGVVSQLNGARRSVVLTCRAQEYGPAVMGTRDDGTDNSVLHGAPVIELLPLTPDEIEQYLREHAHPSKVEKWDRVFANLHKCPGGPLATALSTPLMVGLASTVYAKEHNKPAELLDRSRFGDRESIEGHLLDQLVPAVYSDPRDRWGADDAGRWLAFLASLLQHLKTSKLAWWELTRVTPLPVTGLALGVIGGVLAWLGVIFGVGIGRGVEAGRVLGLGGGIEVGFWAGADVASVSFGLGIVAGVVTGTSGWRVAKDPPAPVTLAVRRRRAKPPRRRLVAGAWPGLLGAFVFGIAVMLLFGVGAGWHVMLLVSVVAPLATGASWSLWLQTVTDTTRAVRPSAVLKQDRRAALANMLGTGLLAGLLVALAVELVVRPTDLPPTLAAGFTAGIGAAVHRGTRTAWVHFLIARAWLAHRRRLPWSLMRFLDDAYGKDKQVLRRVGGVYQFRHALHQDRLARRAERYGQPVPRKRQPGPRKRFVLIGVICVLVIIMASGTGAILRTSRTAECDPPTTATRSDSPPVLLARSRCVFRPSTSVFTNHLDKIDMDTAEPGHGGTGMLVGYARKGGLAEIIVNYHGITSASGAPVYVRMGNDHAADRQACRTALRDRTLRVSGIRHDELRKGDQLCVETDKGRIALVRVQEPPARPRLRLVVSFTVWDG